MSHATTQLILELISKKPMTSFELVDEIKELNRNSSVKFGCSSATVLYHLKMLRHSNKAHICGWALDVINLPSRPIFKAGMGKDTPRPLVDQDDAKKRQKQQNAKWRKQRQKEEYKEIMSIDPVERQRKTGPTLLACVGFFK